MASERRFGVARRRKALRIKYAYGHGASTSSRTSLCRTVKAVQSVLWLRGAPRVPGQVRMVRCVVCTVREARGRALGGFEAQMLQGAYFIYIN